MNLKLEQLAKVFCDKNLKLNLSSYKDLESIKAKNIQDSLLLNNFVKFDNLKVLDVGTGGGFPLLPLAITNPNAFFTGVDSVSKKLDAVIEIAEACGVSNIETVHARVEELAFEPEFREQFDIVCSRAFAKLPINLELCLPFVKLGGYFIAMLGPTAIEQINTYQELALDLGANIEDQKMINTNSGDRLLVKFVKIQATKLRRIHNL